MDNRTSYPAAENVDYAVEALEFTNTSPIPKSFLGNLTKRNKDRFPILYNIMIENHVTSDYFQLLTMLGFCKITQRSHQWYIYDFCQFLQKKTAFDQKDLQAEILEAAKEFGLHEPIATYEITEDGANILRMKARQSEFLISLFYKFFRLTPPYFRFLIQNSQIIGLSLPRKTDLARILSGIVRQKFSDFTNDDMTRILGWSEFFNILRMRSSGQKEEYFFSKEAIVEYVTNALACYLNERAQRVSTFIWKDLSSELYNDLFYEESFLRPESLFEILLEQNPDSYRWGIVERGPGKYAGFRGDSAKQYLQIKATPIKYRYQRNQVPRMSKR